MFKFPKRAEFVFYSVSLHNIVKRNDIACLPYIIKFQDEKYFENELIHQQTIDFASYIEKVEKLK